MNHYLLYKIMVGMLAGSRPPYPINGTIYPREWWGFSLGSRQLASVFSLSDYAKFNFKITEPNNLFI